MSIVIIFQQMLVLFFMITTGFICYKKNFVNEIGNKNISAIIVNILNPLLIISGVLNKEIRYSSKMIRENILLVSILFLILIVISWIYTRFMNVPLREKNSYWLMLIFSNLGFMGIPLISELYGTEAIIFVAFYILGYNILIYTYGIYLASRGNEAVSVKFGWNKLVNPGVIACVIAVLIFNYRITVPQFITSFIGYMGNASIPLSMMAIGISLANKNLKTVFMNAKILLFSLIKMLIIPIVCIFILKNFGFDDVSFGIFALLLSMPVGSVVVLIESEYGGKDNSIYSSGIAVTTVFSIITIPIVAVFI